MKSLVILGGGTAGTALANRLAPKLPRDWEVSLVDPSGTHLYQPALLFLPFGARDEAKAQRPRAATLRPEVKWVRKAVKAVDRDRREVRLEPDGRLPYDLLVIATGSSIHPEETPGLEGEAWGRSIHTFYTLEGALKLRDALDSFQGGRLVLNVAEMPIKCPVAPLEFLFLADSFFRKRGRRSQVELVFATPLEGAFTKPVASKLLGSFLDERGIKVEPEFAAMEVDAEARKLNSYDGRALDYDLLVSIPVHKGADFLGESGLGNELNFVPTDPKSLVCKKDDHLFCLGDATDLPSSKAGSVAHFQSEILEENLRHAIRGESLHATFDGHSNCFIESGGGKALLIDFNYTTEPLPGQFPLPGLGPLPLLRETRRNHFAKLAFRWVYWNMLLPGRKIPFIPPHMSMRGKSAPEPALV